MIVDSTNPRIMADNIRELARNGGGGSGLPEVDVSDVGKVLTVGDTGEWEADDLPPQLPEVDQSDAGKVLMVGDTGEWEADDLPSSGGYDITTTETATNIKIGGATVYVKEYPYVGSNAGTLITNDNIFPLFGFVYRKGSTSSNNGGYMPLIYRSYEGGIYLGDAMPQTISPGSDCHYVIYYLK